MKELKTLKQALEILKKDHKRCRDFDIYCSRCVRSMIINALEHELIIYEDKIRFKKVWKMEKS